MKNVFLKIYENFRIESKAITKASNEKTFFTHFIEYFGYTLSSNFKRTYPALEKFNPSSEKLEPRRMGTKKRTSKKTNVTRKNRSPSNSDIEQIGGQALITPYRPIYRNPQTVSQIIKTDVDKSNIAYYISIDMQLMKGKDPLTPQQMRGLKCGNKWNSVRKSLSELTGTKYVIPPVYENYPGKEKEKNS